MQLDVIDLQARVVVDRQGIHIGQLQAFWRCGQVRVKRPEVREGQLDFPCLARQAKRVRVDVHLEFSGERAAHLLGAESKTDGLHPLRAPAETERGARLQQHRMVGAFPSGDGDRIKHQRITAR